MRIRRSCALVFACLLVLLLAACGGGDDSANEAGGAETNAAQEVRVAFFAFSFDNVYTAAMIDEVKKKAAELASSGVKVDYFDGRFVADTQLGQIRDATASGKYDGFIVLPIDGVAVIPAVEDAIDAGIEVVCTTSTCGRDPAAIETQIPGQLAFIGASGADDGTIQAELTGTACEGKNPCELGYIQGFASNGNDIARLKALKEGLKSYPNVRLVATPEGKFDQAESYRAAQNLLQANPDLDVIASGSDQMTAGAEQAVVEAGKTPGKDVILIGNTASTDAIMRIREGRWFGSPVWLPRTEAAYSLDILVRSLRGEKGLGSKDIRELSPVGPAVTEENADEWDGEWSFGG